MVQDVRAIKLAPQRTEAKGSQTQHPKPGISRYAPHMMGATFNDKYNSFLGVDQMAHLGGGKLMGKMLRVQKGI